MDYRLEYFQKPADGIRSAVPWAPDAKALVLAAANAVARRLSLCPAGII